MTFPDTSFVSGVTVIEANWLNAVNDSLVNQNAEVILDGDGVETEFVIPYENPVSVIINGVYQLPNSYSVNATILQFTEAPPLNSKIQIQY